MDSLTLSSPSATASAGLSCNPSVYVPVAHAPLGVFGINNDSVNTAVNVLMLVLIVIWVALVFWTFADARRRIDDPMLVACATAASLFPFVGTIVYAIVRPPEYLDDVRLRELEMRPPRRGSRQLDYQLCPHCDYEVKARLPALPELHAQAQGALLLVRQAGRPGVEAVPVLRGRDARREPPTPRRAAPSGAGGHEPRRARPVAPSRADEPLARRRARRRTPPAKEPTVDRTLILVKPDAFARGLTGEIIARFERKGLKIVALRAHDRSTEAARQAALRRARRQAVLRRARRASSPPARSWRWCSRARRPIKAARQVIGATNPLEATTGSIRGDFAIAVGQNMVHGSDSPESGRARGRAVLPRPLGRWPVVPRLGLAAAAGDPRAGRASPSRSRPADVEERDAGDPAAVAEENARRKALAVARPASSCSAPTRWSRSTARSSASRADAAQARAYAAAPRRPHARGRRRDRAGRATATSSRPPSRSRAVTFRAARRRALLDWYVATGEWQGRAGGYAIQGARRRAGRARSRATT